jgi:hypothetical protein
MWRNSTYFYDCGIEDLCCFDHGRQKEVTTLRAHKDYGDAFCRKQECCGEEILDGNKKF